MVATVRHLQGKNIPTKLSDALRFAAELAEENEMLQQALKELMMDQYPEVLQSKHMLQLMGWSKTTLTEVGKDPTFPHLDAARKKGDTIRCLKSDFYNWLKTRKLRDVEFIETRRFGSA